MKRFSIVYALLLMGFTAIIAQVLLIRELIVTFSGNELSIGIFFANWLFLEATGSFIAGHIASKVKSPFLPYVILQILIALILPIIIFLSRVIKVELGIIPGEGVNIFTVFYASFILLTPVSLIAGAQFSFGCKLLTYYRNEGARSIGNVYIYEAVGSILGGLVVTYICLQHLNAIQSVFILAIMNISSALLLSFFYSASNQVVQPARSPYIKISQIGLLIILIITFIIGGLDFLQKQSIEKQWPDYKIISNKNSVYGNVAFLKRADQYDLLSNGIPILSLPTPDISHTEDIVHFPLLFHPNPKNIFLLGGGIGGVIKEICKHPVDKIDYAELDPLLIQTVVEFTPNLTESELRDERVIIHYTDGRHYLIYSTEKYDLIILNLPDPSTLELNRFYTKEFFQICAAHLNPAGILLFQMPGSASYMNLPLIRLNSCLLNTASEVFTDQLVIPFENNIVLVSNNHQLLKADWNTLSQRLQNRHIDTRSFSETYIRYRLDERRIQWFERELDQSPRGQINSDMKPTALFMDMIYWNSVQSPQFANFYGWFENLELTHFALLILVIFAIIFILQRYHKPSKKIHILSSILSSGFSGMGLTIIMVLIFQSFYGYVYFWIGLIITTFMVGLASGSLSANRLLRSTKTPVTLFLKTEITFVLYIGILVAGLFYINNFQGAGFIHSILHLFVLLFTSLCGLVVGAQFPLANQLYMDKPGRFTRTAGTLYASDLIGAWAGGILVTLILVPVVGMLETGLLLLLLKFCSTVVFRLARADS